MLSHTLLNLHNIDNVDVIDTFVHPAKVGIVDFNYNLVCPFCGGIVHSRMSLNEIDPESFYCSLCDLKSQTTLDDQVEVSFTVNSAIRKIELDPYLNFPGKPEILEKKFTHLGKTNSYFKRSGKSCHCI